MSDYFVKDNLAGLKREDFQATVQGKKTDLYILKNKKGAERAVTNFAGALCAVMMPDRDGRMESVVYLSSMEVYGVTPEDAGEIREKDLGFIDYLIGNNLTRDAMAWLEGSNYAPSDTPTKEELEDWRS